MEEGNASPLGRLVKELREHRHWERSELAQRAGLTRVCVWKIEEGGIDPKVGTLLALLRALQMSAGVLDPLIESCPPAPAPAEPPPRSPARSNGRKPPAKKPEPKKRPPPGKPARSRSPARPGARAGRK